MDNNKISISAIGAPQEPDKVYMQMGNTTVEITRHIPFAELLDAIQWSIDFIIGDKPFISAPLKKIVEDFAILNFFTNIDVGRTERYATVDDIYRDYDILMTYNVAEEVSSKIDQKQLNYFHTTLDGALESITTYRNSAKGIVDALSASASSDIDRMDAAMEILGDDKQNEKISQLLKFAQTLGADKEE